MTGGVWMDAIIKVQQRIARDSCQQIRHQRRAILPGYLPKHGAKRGDIRIIGHDRKLHSHDDNGRRRIPCSHPLDCVLQVFSDLRDRYATESVVDSQLENEDIDTPSQIRGEPPQSSFTRASADAGVDHAKVRIDALQPFFDQRRPGLARPQTVTGGEAIAEHEHIAVRPAVRGRGAEVRQRYHAQEVEEKSGPHFCSLLASSEAAI